MELSQFPINPITIANMTAKGFTTPTEIQEKAWPLLIEKQIDFVGLAQTGTGKTAAFVIPLLEKVDVSSNDLQVLILAPTRELVSQVSNEIVELSKGTKIRSNVVYGGIRIDGQISDYKRNRPHILVASPGRLIDMIERKVVNIETLKLIVLDEADEMMSQGFIDDIDWVLDNSPKEKNIWLFSATMSSEVNSLKNKYLKNPESISVQKSAQSKANITQTYYLVKSRKKIQALTQMLITLGDYYGMVFCNTKIEAKKVCDELNQIGVPADSLHGDIVQAQRDTTMKRFKERKIKLLVCTDVAARGIDVQDLTHVFNYDLPQELESYVHRIGRTGRAGKAGAAISFVYESDLFKIKRLERMLNVVIEKKVFLSEDAVKKSLIKSEIEKFENSFGKQKISEDADFQLFADSIETMDVLEMKKWLYLSVVKSKIVKFHLSESVGEDRKPRDFGGDRGGERGGYRDRGGGGGGRFRSGGGGDRGYSRDRDFAPRSDRGFAPRADQGYSRSAGGERDRTEPREGGGERAFAPRRDRDFAPRRDSNRDGGGEGRRDFAPRREGGSSDRGFAPRSSTSGFRQRSSEGGGERRDRSFPRKSEGSSPRSRMVERSVKGSAERSEID